MEQRTAKVVGVVALALGFLFFVPVISMAQTQAQSCASESSTEAAQAEPEKFEPCLVPEFGSVTYAALGAGGVWMEDEYSHYYVVCASGPTSCT
jgi:hypothetical protein